MHITHYLIVDIYFFQFYWKNISLSPFLPLYMHILKDMEKPGHITCLLRKLYVGQETTVRTVHGTADWFKIWKGVCQGSILSPCLFNLYAEHTMQNAWLDESQAEINIAWKNINNLRYADNTTLMVESQKEPMSLLMKIKEKSEKAGLKLNI